MSGRHYLNQIIKADILSKGINQNPAPPDRMQWDHSIVAVIFLPKMRGAARHEASETEQNKEGVYAGETWQQWWEFNEETLNNSTSRDIYKITGL